MRIFDETKTKELNFDDIDFSKGQLEESTIVTHIPEQQEIVEQFHYETIKEYENGGKDVQKIIDVVGHPFVEAHDEIEEIKIFVSYSQQELEYHQNCEQIEILKEWFETYYAQHEQKYRRLHTLKKLCDDGTEPMTKLLELYEEAEDKRRQIQNLEKVVENNGTLHDDTL